MRNRSAGLLPRPPRGEEPFQEQIPGVLPVGDIYWHCPCGYGAEAYKTQELGGVAASTEMSTGALRGQAELCCRAGALV